MLRSRDTLTKDHQMSRLDELDVVIRRKNGKFIAGILEFGLFGKGNDFNAAITALDAKKEAFVADLEEAGELEMLDIESPAVRARRPAGRVTVIGPGGGLGQFALKTAIVMGFIVAAFAITGVLIASKVDKAVSNVKSIKIGGSQFWAHAQDELDRMASTGSDLPEAKKQKLLEDIHAIAVKWRPLIVEVQSAFADPNNAQQPAKTSTKK
jgi:hypothetical protein